MDEIFGIFNFLFDFALEVWFSIFSLGHNTFDRDLNQYRIVVPLFGAAYIKYLTLFTVLIYSTGQSWLVARYNSFLEM